eukprot:m.365568 g.365568  ORF g.365568 m.365568 type:complete len:53 (-) comp31995_c0_seq1:13-171(-)
MAVTVTHTFTYAHNHTHTIMEIDGEQAKVYQDNHSTVQPPRHATVFKAYRQC